MCPELKLLIGGKWTPADVGKILPVVNPATGKRIG